MRTAKSPAFLQGSCFKLAEWTGLEPATSGVTGQHSNRLNYHSAVSPQSYLHFPQAQLFFRILVGTEGIEPPTRSL